MDRKTIVLAIAALFLMMSFASINNETVAEKTDFDNVDHIKYVEGGSQEYPTTCTIDNSGDTFYLNLNGVHIKYIYIEIFKPVVISLNGNNVIDFDRIGSAIEIDSFGNIVKITGESLTINLLVVASSAILIDTYNEAPDLTKSHLIENADIKINGSGKTVEDIMSNFECGITFNEFPLLIKNSKINMSNVCCGISNHTWGTYVEISNTTYVMNNPETTDTPYYFIDSYGGELCGIVTDKSPVGDNIKFVDMSGEEVEPDSYELLGITTTGCAKIICDPIVDDAGNNDLLMKIVIVGCALIAVVCFGYTLYGRK